MEKKTNARTKDAQAAGSTGIDLDSLSRLMQLMSENAITEVEYDDGKLALRLSKTAGAAPIVAAAQPVAPPAPVAAAPVAPQAAPAAAPAADEKRLEITSPMVGTFYASPSPDSEAYVTVGSQVSEDTVVCLIEAMKVFNEIKAGVSGKITRILVKNEDPVEFGQPMFLVEPL